MNAVCISSRRIQFVHDGEKKKDSRQTLGVLTIPIRHSGRTCDMREIIHYEEPLFRPPAEAESLIFQVARGCPHNSCRFCGMYKGVRYHLRNEQEVLHEMEQAGKAFPDVRRIFLADGDVMALPFDLLKKYLEFLLKVFPQVRRINLYANGSSIAARTEEELQILRNLRVQTLYMVL